MTTARPLMHLANDPLADMIRAFTPPRLAAFAALAAFGLLASLAASREAQAQQMLQGAIAPAPAKPAAQPRPPRTATPQPAPVPPRRPVDPPAANDAAAQGAGNGEPARTGTTPPANRPLLAPLAPPPLPAPAPAPPTPLADPQERAALRACAEDWRRMQASGEADGLLWREFSAECRARSGAPRMRPQAQAPLPGPTRAP